MYETNVVKIWKKVYYLGQYTHKVVSKESSFLKEMPCFFENKVDGVILHPHYAPTKSVPVAIQKVWLCHKALVYHRTPCRIKHLDLCHYNANGVNVTSPKIHSLRVKNLLLKFRAIFFNILPLKKKNVDSNKDLVIPYLWNQFWGNC